MSDRGGFFVMILFPWGPKPMTTETDDPSDPKVTMFATNTEAREVAMKSRAVIAYGAEIFEIGTGDTV